MRLPGIFPSVTTPFDYKGNLYPAKLQHNVEKWNRTSLSGYVVCASAGESMFLTTDEKAAVWELAAKYAAPGKLLIAGASAESVRETVALANRAADLGYQAALVTPPHDDQRISQRPELQMLYYRAVADESRIPVILDNRPQSTGVDLSAETAADLSRHPNIIGLNETSGNLEKLMQVLREAEAGFQVLTGSAATLWPSLLMGASGAMLAFASAAPYASIAIWEAYRTREEEAGRD
ncbi:MAG TPA: dihydrodipicolinate synthase family protein, partial [Bryobacteraceae bacterium]|nr:dihydrodipicolinate synthase family protein [Bryobacteraceae bacterium]